VSWELTLRRRREDDRKPPRDAPPVAPSWCAPADGCSGGVVDSGGVVCPLLDELHGLNTGTAGNPRATITTRLAVGEGDGKEGDTAHHQHPQPKQKHTYAHSRTHNTTSHTRTPAKNTAVEPRTRWTGPASPVSARPTTAAWWRWSRRRAACPGTARRTWGCLSRTATRATTAIQSLGCRSRHRAIQSLGCRSRHTAIQSLGCRSRDTSGSGRGLAACGCVGVCVGVGLFGAG
jgi:hypothetical protein